MSRVVPSRPYRWNFTMMGLDYSLFILGLSFASIYGVLPLFVRHLSEANLALGALPALRALGLLPPLFIAAFTERLRRKKPFVLGCTVFERVPYLGLAVATPLLVTSHPTELLWLLFAMLALTTVAGGLSMPAWLDLLARMLPEDWRGRFFGLAAALGGLLGVGGGAGAAALLQRYGWSRGSALCFACTFGCLVASFVCIALGREPSPARDAPPQRRAGAWRRWPALVRRDRNLRGYLVALGLLTCAGAAAPFYVVDAAQSLRLSDAAASRYAVVLLAATTLGNVLWGYVGDHGGHKRVLLGGAFGTGLAALTALATRAPGGGVLVYGAAFLLLGLGTSGLQLSAFTVIIDLAPEAQRPTYVGLATMAQAPFAVGAPLVAALLADRGGYPPVFAAAAALALVGLVVARRGVRDPRRATAARPAPVEAP